MKMKRREGSRNLRSLIIALLAGYYLMCIFCAYDAWFRPFPSQDKMQSYTGVYLKFEQLSTRFGGDKVRLLFADGTQIIMDESFDAKDALALRSGDRLTVLGGRMNSGASDLRGYAIDRNHTEIHDLQKSLNHLEREQLFNRILCAVLALTPPAIAAFGMIFERSLLGKPTKEKN